MKAREIMTADPHAVEAESSLRDVVEALRGWNVRGAPVVTGTKVVGVISITDIAELQATSPGSPAFHEEEAEFGEWDPLESWEEGESPPMYFRDLWPDAGADVSVRMASTEGPEWDFLAEHVASEVMTTKVLSVGPEDDVREAARLMRDAGAHRVLVAHDDELIGIISASDIVKAVADGKI